MSHVTLVRHGQARSGAKDEASYDNLSDLGHAQAEWLGQYLAQTNHGFSRILCGSLNRQRDTARAIAKALDIEIIEDVRLNEINYFELSDCIHQVHSLPQPTSRDDFLGHMPRVLKAWHDKEISCSNETFADYESRVNDVLCEAESHGSTMLVTSGGIIGMAIRLVLNLDNDAFAHFLLQTNNASFHKYQIEAGARRLLTFNATPHLDGTGREAARTYI